MSYFDLLEIDFEWGGRYGETPGLDCLGLAMEVRRRLLPLAEPLPNFETIYKAYDRDSIPPDIILNLMLASPRATKIDKPSPGCLALLQGERAVALGTFIGNYDRILDAVILFGTEEKPVIISDCNLPNLIGYFKVI